MLKKIIFLDISSQYLALGTQIKCLNKNEKSYKTVVNHIKESFSNENDFAPEIKNIFELKRDDEIKNFESKIKNKQVSLFCYNNKNLKIYIFFL